MTAFAKQVVCDTDGAADHLVLGHRAEVHAIDIFNSKATATLTVNLRDAATAALGPTAANKRSFVVNAQQQVRIPFEPPLLFKNGVYVDTDADATSSTVDIEYS